MNSQDKLLAAARRAAKAMSRAEDIPYQRCLDLVAQRTGRPTWRAFLSDPAPIDKRAAAAAGEPDFSAIPPELHYETAVRYGIHQGASTLKASPRAWNDKRPVLSFSLPEGRDHPIDARGLDLDAFAASCLGSSDEMHRPGPRRITWAGTMPEFEGTLMRAQMTRYLLDDMPSATIGIGLDGSNPPEVDAPRAPVKPYDTQTRIPSLAQRLRLGARHLLGGDQRHALKVMKERGPLGVDAGPLVGHVRRQAMRLRPGYNMLVVSPPGTGRLASVTYTALLTDNRASYLVHDHGQHLETTSGWRSTFSRIAVIRLDSDSPDAINPFDASWLPSGHEAVQGHIDAMMQSIVQGDAPTARLLTEAAMRLISREGGTTLRAVRKELATMLDHPLARRTIGLLAPLTTDGAHNAFGRNTVVPEELRGRAVDGHRPITIYVVRNPGNPSPRDILAAAIQTAVWRRLLSPSAGENWPNRSPKGADGFVTILSDLHIMPMMPGLDMAMGLGRAWKVSTIVTSAAGGAIEARYGKDLARLIVATSSLQLGLRQSSPSDMPFVDPGNDVGYETLSSLPMDKAWAIMENGLPPLLMRRSFFYDPPTSDRYYNPRTGQGPLPYA